MRTATLLIDPPLPGVENMARDEALLASCADADAAPVVRLYAWSQPTISLGYFQGYCEYESLPAPAGDLPVVRRTTGGGAILHDLELTYSIVIGVDHPLVAGRPVDLYRRVHEAIIRVIGSAGRLAVDGGATCDASAQRGPFFCFERRHALDVVIDEGALGEGGGGAPRKIAGSAQRRTRTAILQHGSLMLDSRFSQQVCATWSEQGGPGDYKEAARRLAPFLARSLGVEFILGAWQPDVLSAADRLHVRYASAAWTRDRQR